MKIAVLIATRDEERCINQRIANVLACETPKDASVSLHILDNGSTDRTRECVLSASSREMDIVLHEFDAIGKCASLFRGFEQIEADLFILTDANTEFAKDALVHFAVSQRSNSDASVFVGNIRNVRQKQDGEAFLLSDSTLPLRLRIEEHLGVFSGANGGCYAVAAKGVSGIWHHPPVRNDDFVISVYAASKGRVVRVPEAKAYEIEHFSLRNVYASKYRDALGHYRALIWIWSHVPGRSGKLAIFTRATIWFVIPLIAIAILLSFPPIVAALGLAILLLLPKTRLTFVRTIALFSGFFAGLFAAPPPTWKPTR